MKFTAAFPALLLNALLGASVPIMAIAQSATSDTKTAAPIRDVLLSQVGKRISVRLNGDQDIEGTVTSVSPDTVLISKVTGKDFYDAVVSISKISAVIYKAR